MDSASKVGILAIGLAVWPQGSVRAESCPSAGAQSATIAGIEPRLELRLADGRLLRLAGLDPSRKTPTDPDLAETARRHLTAETAGRTVFVQLLSSAPDRWGRWPARAFLPGDTAGLAARAIAEGLGRYLAEPAASDCRGPLLLAEGKAREAKLGLWADPYYAVLAVDDQAAFVARSGTIVVAEGNLRDVEPGPYRTRLHFVARGSQGRHLLTATILPRVMKVFEAKGVIFPSLIGSTLRLRGLLDLRFGPQIELAGPDDVEIIPVPAH